MKANNYFKIFNNSIININLGSITIASSETVVITPDDSIKGKINISDENFEKIIEQTRSGKISVELGVDVNTTEVLNKLNSEKFICLMRDNPLECFDNYGTIHEDDLSGLGEDSTLDDVLKNGNESQEKLIIKDQYDSETTLAGNDIKVKSAEHETVINPSGIVWRNPDDTSNAISLHTDGSLWISHHDYTPSDGREILVYQDLNPIKDSIDLKADKTELHNHNNKPTLDKLGQSSGGMLTYNGLSVDTVIAQRDVYDGLDSDDNTISLSAKQGKVLKTGLDSHYHNTLARMDVRATNPDPYEVDSIGLKQLFKSNSVDGLSDGGTYHSVLEVTQWSDTSGGKVHQLGITDNNNLYMRSGSSTWSSWEKFLQTADLVGINSDISTLRTDVNTNSSNISGNAGNISSNFNKISTNTSNIATNTGDITALETSNANKVDHVKKTMAIPSAGTYIIATGGNRVNETIYLTGVRSSYHDTVTINISFNHGYGNVTILNKAAYQDSANAIKSVKLYYKTSNRVYGGAYLVIETLSNTSLYYDSNDTSPWKMTPITPTTTLTDRTLLSTCMIEGNDGYEFIGQDMYLNGVINANIINSRSNPTGGTHVGNRNYNDGRYSLTSHNHDSRYYTESEIDTKLNTKENVTNYLVKTQNNLVNWIKPKNGSSGTSTASPGKLMFIKLPVGMTNTMVNFTVDIYDYETDRTVSLHLGGYTSISQGKWINVSATVIGSSNEVYKAMFVDATNSTGKAHIVIGKWNGVAGDWYNEWTYPQVNIRDVSLGYRNQTSWAGDWDISYADGLPSDMIDHHVDVWAGLNATLFCGHDHYYWAKSEDLDWYFPLGGGILNGNVGRTKHENGFLVGSYNNIGQNATKTNPIYTIGSGYMPKHDTLYNMYGIGFTHTNASFITGGGYGWGMYVASDGNSRLFLNATEGNIYDGNGTKFSKEDHTHRGAGKVVWSKDTNVTGGSAQYFVTTSTSTFQKGSYKLIFIAEDSNISETMFIVTDPTDSSDLTMTETYSLTDYYHGAVGVIKLQIRDDGKTLYMEPVININSSPVTRPCKLTVLKMN